MKFCIPYHSIAVCFFMSLVACGSGAESRSDTTMSTCANQGFCLTRNDGTLLCGAFRVGDDEVQFQIAKDSINFLSPWIGGGRLCGRLLSDEGHVFVNMASCRDEWTHQIVLRSVQRTEVYREAASQLQAYIQENPAPEGREGEWGLLKELLSTFLSRPARAASEVG